MVIAAPTVMEIATGLQVAALAELYPEVPALEVLPAPV